MMLCPYKKKITTTKLLDETMATEEFCACEKACMAYVEVNEDVFFCALMFNLNADVGHLGIK